MKVLKNPAVKLWPQLWQRPVVAHRVMDTLVTEIFENVVRAGDKALIAYTKQFDNVDLSSVVLQPETIQRLAQLVAPELKQAIDHAWQNIQTFHAAQTAPQKPARVETEPGVTCWRESRAIERIGLYIPGGTAPLVSTVLMLGVPARLAGCKEIILCTPPEKDGKISAAICYAAQKVGATKIITLGGAQAIAGLALGTATIPKVDKIFGPGNQYVTAAKLYAQQYGVAYDMPAGPSEVMVCTDSVANPAFVAADLLSQAEHGKDSQVVLVTTSEALALQVRIQIAKQLRTLPRKEIISQALKNSLCVTFNDWDQACRFVNGYAPEHLILNVRHPKALTGKIVNAGSIFLGSYTPESAGDYVSGTNHTLPTGGWAKSFSGVSVDSFTKQLTFQSISKAGLSRLVPSIDALSNAEGLEAHGRAARIRITQK